MKNDLTLARQLIKQCQETQNPNLELGNCGIEDLNDLPELFECTHLQSLNLSNQWLDRSNLKLTNSKNKGNPNLFDTVPLRIESLKGLKDLVIFDNKISDIHFLEKLSGLQTLYLTNNLIKEIPLSFFKTAITISFEPYDSKGLCLDGNPIESPPLEIIKQGKKSVLDWFAANRKKLNEIKIILIGDPKAGKTSLLRRLKNNEFNEKEEPTDGVNIESIQFSTCESFKENNALHNLTGHFWDFGGQEIMNATHQFFLTKRSVYILVLDARKDTNIAQQVRQWVKRVSATGGNSPIIVVANQIDVNTGFGFSNQVELRKEFPQIACFIEASCQTGVGLDKIKKKLEELVPKADLFNTEIDERWIDIKEQLAEETGLKYILDETRFNEICNAKRLIEKEGRKNAIGFFNDLGILLHFEDLNLAEYYVLDPYWITYGVYRIVTSKYAGEQKGIVGIDKLYEIVNEEEDKISKYHSAYFKKISYTTNQIWFLVNALHQFKLCFYFNDRSKLIIPDLLDTREPTEVTNNIRNAEGCIRFVYEYDYLPSPLIPYLMVETNNKLEEFWRTGCVLTNESCKALVSTYNERLLITVAGEPVEKTYFMAVLRNLVERINKKLNVDPKMLVPLPDTDKFAPYRVLLAMQKAGKKYYSLDEYLPTQKDFEISILLEGMPGPAEVQTANSFFKELIINTNLIKDGIEKLKEGQHQILSSQEKYYLEIIEIKENRNVNKELMEALKVLTEEQTDKIINEVMEWIAIGFQTFDKDMNHKIKELYADLKKTSDHQLKLSLSVPFINLLGVNFKYEWDVKNSVKKTYNKHELKIYHLMGLL